jgi:hypothetical protein
MFKIRASQASKIMGRVGLTDTQRLRMDELQARDTGTGKPLTPNMVNELEGLKQAYFKPTLPETCITYLKEYYANDKEFIYSKYTEKGNYCEMENIDLAARVLGYGIAEKNELNFSDEFFIGTPDCILHDCILDVKSSWNKKTLYEAATGEINKDYATQLQIYMELCGKDKAILFYGLQDTPEEAGGYEVVYSDIPEYERWVGFYIYKDPNLIQAIRDRVLLCRQWLKEYDELIKNKLGKLL